MPKTAVPGWVVSGTKHTISVFTFRNQSPVLTKHYSDDFFFTILKSKLVGGLSCLEDSDRPSTAVGHVFRGVHFRDGHDLFSASFRQDVGGVDRTGKDLFHFDVRRSLEGIFHQGFKTFMWDRHHRFRHPGYFC